MPYKTLLPSSFLSLPPHTHNNIHTRAYGLQQQRRNNQQSPVVNSTASTQAPGHSNTPPTMGNSTSSPNTSNPTPSQLYAAHTSAHPKPPHLRGPDQRLRTTATPTGGANTGSGAAGLQGFMKGFSPFSGNGTGQGGSGGRSKL